MNTNLPNEYFRDRTELMGANLGAQVLLYPDRNIYKSYGHGMANLNMGSDPLDIILWRNVSTQNI